MTTLNERVEKRMENARTLSQGTMPVEVVFDTDEEAAAARAWLKGKRNVAKLTVKVIPKPK